MPNYNYKCYGCGQVESKFLPISTDPNKCFGCTKCINGTTRRIHTTKPSATIGLKTFAGDWFKKTYGHELGEDGQSNEAKRRDFQKAVEEHKKEA